MAERYATKRARFARYAAAEKCGSVRIAAFARYMAGDRETGEVARWAGCFKRLRGVSDSCGSVRA